MGCFWQFYYHFLVTLVSFVFLTDAWSEKIAICVADGSKTLLIWLMLHCLECILIHIGVSLSWKFGCTVVITRFAHLRFPLKYATLTDIFSSDGFLAMKTDSDSLENCLMKSHFVNLWAYHCHIVSFVWFFVKCSDSIIHME